MTKNGEPFSFTSPGDLKVTLKNHTTLSVFCRLISLAIQIRDGGRQTTHTSNYAVLQTLLMPNTLSTKELPRERVLAKHFLPSSASSLYFGRAYHENVASHCARSQTLGDRDIVHTQNFVLSQIILEATSVASFQLYVFSIRFDSLTFALVITKSVTYLLSHSSMSGPC